MPARRSGRKGKPRLPPSLPRHAFATPLPGVNGPARVRLRLRLRLASGRPLLSKRRTPPRPAPSCTRASLTEKARGDMRLVSWNINGIRRAPEALRRLLDSLGADVTCLQETRVTRDLLEEPLAIVEGYSSYFSFSRGRSGYSGVATFCKNNATPGAAEEGLTNLLTNHEGAVGAYGNTEEFTEDELRALDSEGRAVLTQHQIRTSDGHEKTLTIINVYCPHADPDKPERLTYKLRFYRLLQLRAEALLRAGSHVIILGDVNTSHRPLDHCDPADLACFEENPGRQWLTQFLWQPDGESGLFVDSFRHFHPTKVGAFTCWSTATGARLTNYGTRLDYILGDRALVLGEFEDSFLMPEVEGSDHCPVGATLRAELIPAPRCPPLCTQYLPEFAGRQQKLSRFLVKVDPNLPGPASAQHREEKNGVGASKNRAKRTCGDPGQGQLSLLRFFQAGRPPEKALITGAQEPESELTGRDPGGAVAPAPEPGEGQAAFWKSVLRGPPRPPLCKGHGEPCVLRTVRKAGPNFGRQFYVCSRPIGHSGNPVARCDFFLWVSSKTPAPH
ncbi:DNA-(apurinic or apyrimidinic site) endonuclease 2 isoform X1 [Sminthopsis crassicaudata]|uniref:DNA-(apurinic or apyrimidinic site) endonuclease 2 isoform X1 n=1 Tax=Sminthopsis crassicaudata TaxID=9301 RepID=UPI003D684F08